MKQLHSVQIKPNTILAMQGYILQYAYAVYNMVAYFQNILFYIYKCIYIFVKPSILSFSNYYVYIEFDIFAFFWIN